MTTLVRRCSAVVISCACIGFVSIASAGAQAPPPGSTTAMPGRPPGSGGPGMPGAPPRDPSARPAPLKGTAVISGRVVAADTGQPLRRARVGLHGNGMGREGSRNAMTDADGTFRIDGLPAGRYSLSASKARYVPTMLGARRPGASGRPIDLADGQRIENVTFALTNAGVITGHVTDDSGEPLIDVQVQAMRYRAMRGTRQLMPHSMSSPTDDTGAYRIHGLAPGTYYVMARDQDSMRFGPEDGPSEESGFASTYYPGTPVESEAQPIEVVAGVDAVADLALVPTRLTTVSGIVLSAAGAPATGGGVSLLTGGFGFGSSRSGAMIKPDGTFRITGVTPGEYTLQAHPTFEAPTPFGPPRFAFGMNRTTASMPIVVAGTPLADLRLVVLDNIRIPVTATFEATTEKPPEMVGINASSEKNRSGASAMRGEDGRLTLDVPPGTWRLSAHAGPPWRVRRLSYRGREVEPGDEVELTAEPGGRIEAVFTTSKGSVVTGGVKNGSGNTVSDYIAFILPAEGDIAGRLGFGRFQVARPDQQGRFSAEGLRPGEYVAIAVEDLDMEEMFEPDVLEGLRKAGTPFRLREGENPVLDLTLSSLP